MQAASAPVVLEAPAAVSSSPGVHFADVYQVYFPFVWRNAQSLGVRRAALDDVVQEVFMIVHSRLHEFEGRSTLRTWLSGIALNVVRHHRRSIERKSPHERAALETTDPDDLPSTEPDPSVSAEILEQTRLLQQLLATLDDEKREVLVLADLEELTTPEIAEALGIKLNTAYSRLRLAREQFNRNLARHRMQNQWKHS